jgi:putative spermidine/putrescine transport system permease protein
LCFWLFPLVFVVAISVYKGDPIQDDVLVPVISLRHYFDALEDGYYLKILLETVKMAIGITLLALFFGLPTAHFLARTQSRFKSVMLLAIILPLFIGNAVRAIGWMLALGDGGILDRMALAVGASHPFHIMYTETAVLIGATAVNLPYVILTLQSVIERIDPSIEEVSNSLGATPFETWRLVMLPMMYPGVVAASTLSFILSMNAYATPVLLGGPSFRMMAPAIADEMLGKNNWPVGAVLAVILIAVTLVLAAALNRVFTRPGITVGADSR